MTAARKLFRFFILLSLSSIIFGFSTVTSAFPELISHGYTSCVSCHVSPTGGGIVTPYGRALSDEAISIWSGSETETQFLNGKVTLPPWLLLGGDIRAAQLHKDDPTIRKGVIIFMQADLEAVASINEWKIAGTFGLAQGKEKGTFTGESRRHYISYQATEKLSARVGKFFPAFGIKTPDHVIFTRKDLGWDQGNETYNAEMIYLSERYEIFLDGIYGKIDDSKAAREKGGSARFSYNFLDSFNVGFSYFQGQTEESNREIFGIFGILGFTESSSLLSEIDFQKTKKNGDIQNGRVFYNKFSYGIWKGFNATATAQQSHLNILQPDLLKNYYGLGFQAFPKAHYEIQFEWQWRQDPLVSKDELSHFAWLQAHYYL